MTYLEVELALSAVQWVQNGYDEYPNMLARPDDGESHGRQIDGLTTWEAQQRLIDSARLPSSFFSGSSIASFPSAASWISYLESLCLILGRAWYRALAMGHDD